MTKKLGRQTGVSPETYLEHCFNEVRGDLPSFIHSLPFIMRTSKGKSLNDFINQHGRKQLSKSLNQLHDWVLYDSSMVIDKEKKDVLHDVKLLARHLNRR
jgi:hypothetical protein